eukprot:m.99276 g.99276  ORF g.99276 m.99276 type:complete len:388 (-) comp27142_c1_seq1:411-1574(-)
MGTLKTVLNSRLPVVKRIMFGGRSWFEKLFGFDEGTDCSRRAALVHDQVYLENDPHTKGGELLVSRSNGAKYRVGIFETPSLAELRERALASKSADMKTGALRISHLSAGDIFKRHPLTENRNAMFQAASQFNCLEFAAPNVVPEDGVTDYMYDGTQGPACSLAAAPATVYRNYFVPLGGKVGQSRHNQINNLEGVLEALDGTEIVQVKNGYTAVKDAFDTNTCNEKLAELNENIEACDRISVMDKLRIGVHSQVEVPFASKWQVGEHRSIVSQAFCSALAIGYARGSPLAWAPLARIVLDASYEATLWAAADEYARGVGSGKVMLTFIGGGVFQNDEAWINHAIGRACALVSKAGFPLDVVVCHYGEVGRLCEDEVEHAFKSTLGR